MKEGKYEEGKYEEEDLSRIGIPRLSLPEVFESAARRYADRVFLKTLGAEGREWTFAESKELVFRGAVVLKKCGLQKGDRVILSGVNSPYWVLAFWAIQKAGGVAVPLDAKMDEETFLRLSRLTEAKIFFTDQDRCEALREKASFETYFSLSPGHEDFFPAKSEELCPDDFPSAGFPVPAGEDLAVILFTSGTTGDEKGVLLSQRNLTSNIYQVTHPSVISVRPEDRFLALLPFHHSYPLTAVFLEAACYGAGLVFPAKMSASGILRDVEEGGVTLFLGVPLLFNKILHGIEKELRARGSVLAGVLNGLLKISGIFREKLRINLGKFLFSFLRKKTKMASVRMFISGGGALIPKTVRGFRRMGFNLIEGYGMTETAPILTLNTAEPYCFGSVGTVLPGIDLKIDNPDPEGIGEIAVKGPNVTAGYYKNDRATEELFNEEGYLKTGDMGCRDSEGFLYLTGRKKLLIVTEEGKNIFPEEIENAFQEYPEAEQVLVRGYISNEERRSESVEILFYPNPEEFQGKSRKETEQFFEELVRETNRKFPRYKRIQRVRVLDEALPVTTTRKIKRR